MEIELVKPKLSLIQLLQSVDKNIKQEIIKFTNLSPKHWWYLDEPVKKFNYQSFCFDPSDNFLIIYQDYHKTRLFNIKTRKEIHIPSCTYYNLETACFDASGKFLAIASDYYCPHQHIIDNKTHIIDLQTHQNIACLSSGKKYIYFASDEKYSMTPSKKIYDHKSYILAQHENYTLEQLLLKKALLTWLLIEKPNKKITTHESLLKDVALKCDIPYDLLEIWKTFPHNMQMALWRTMEYRIQTYGKDSKDNCIIQ